MKKLRFLVPVFSFGLILAFALLSQQSVGSDIFLSVSDDFYAASSKSFSALSVRAKVGDISFEMPTAFFQLLVFFITVGVFIFFYVLILKRNKKKLSSEEKDNQEEI